jgi:hypothetical protein
MSSHELDSPDEFKVPNCCLACIYLDGEYSDYDGLYTYMCNLNVWFPTVKKICKRQRSKGPSRLKGNNDYMEKTRRT